MVRNRIVYVLFFILTIAFSYFYPGFVSSLFFYTAFLIPVASFIYTFYIYQKFNYLQSIDKKFVTKGEKVCFNVDIVNESKLIYPYIEVIFYGVDTIFTKHFKTRKIAILPHSTGHYDFELECKYRGYYEVGLKRIGIRDFLGLIKLEYEVFHPKYITVYPKIVALDRFPISSNRQSYVEGTLNEKDEDDLCLSDIRKYAYGDSMKKIHWKLSAKKEEMMIKKYDSSFNVGVTVVLDLEKKPYGIVENTIIEDKMIEATLAIIYYCLSHHIKLEFKYFDCEVVTTTASDFSYFHSIYNSLFKIKFESEIKFTQIVKLAFEGNMKSNTIVLVTASLNDQLFSQISIQHEKGYEIILVYVSPKALIAENDSQETEIKNILLALQEINVKAYEIHINDDIKYILES